MANLRTRTAAQPRSRRLTDITSIIFHFWVCAVPPVPSLRGVIKFIQVFASLPEKLDPSRHFSSTVSDCVVRKLGDAAGFQHNGVAHLTLEIWMGRRST
jgi:hypothetical protein